MRTISDVIPRNANQRREVYFVQAAKEGLIKIGVANDARRRLSSIRTDSPVPLDPLGIMVCNERGALENRLHRQFAHLRQRGEWYRAEPELLDFIRENAEPFDDAERDWRWKCEVVAAIACEPVRYRAFPPRSA